MKQNFKISKDLNVFTIKESGNHIFYCIDEIVCIKSEEDYFQIYHPKPSCLIIGTIKKISMDLPDHFIIPHKSYIVNMKKVKKLCKDVNNKLYLIMDNKMKVPLAKSALPKIKKFFI